MARRLSEVLRFPTLACPSLSLASLSKHKGGRDRLRLSILSLDFDEVVFDVARPDSEMSTLVVTGMEFSPDHNAYVLVPVGTVTLQMAQAM